jgi:outer membrane protein TolC
MKIKFLIILLINCAIFGQETSKKTLTFDEYLGYVKKFHPIVKQANLQVSQAQAAIMAARGGFDPKLEVDYNTKKFKTQEYFTILNSSFKIPTWYGIEIKAAFDKNEGLFINPQDNLPTNGLSALGISIPLGQGLFINNRMAALRQAKIYNTLSEAERDLEVNNVLFEASKSYFNWHRNYSEYKLYDIFLNNAKIRFKGIQELIKAGDKPAIDSIEAGIVVKNRKLNLEQSRIKLVKSSLELSNFLWLENNIPFELQENIIPEQNLQNNVESTLKLNNIGDVNLTNHPKIISLQSKVRVLEIEKKLKGDLLKPRLDFNYNYIAQNPVAFQDLNTDNYKYGLSFSFPLFLRKERGNYKMAKFKLENAKLDYDFENVSLKNKINAQIQEVASLQEQIKTASELVTDFNTMLKSEERLFFFGESSIFLINTRENSLLSSSIQEIDINNRYFNAQADLFRTRAIQIN